MKTPPAFRQHPLLFTLAQRQCGTAGSDTMSSVCAHIAEADAFASSAFA